MNRTDNEKIKDDGISILFYLYKNPESTTTEIARNVFEIEDDTDLRNKDRKVRYYLEDKYGHLVKREKESGKKKYKLTRDVFFGLGKIDVESYKGEEVSIGLGNVLVYKDEEERPMVVNVEMEER